MQSQAGVNTVATPLGIGRQHVTVDFETSNDGLYQLNDMLTIDITLQKASGGGANGYYCDTATVDPRSY